MDVISKRKVTHMPKIAIIEDDPLIRSELQTLLTANGYAVMAPTCFSHIPDSIRQENPQLILLDIRLPDISGFTLCTQIRSFTDVPIIFVTSCNSDMDELQSIMLGGDAFITKPYNTAILLAKIAALLKRFDPQGSDEQLAWKGAVLHLDTGKLSHQEQAVDLTKNEMKILYYLFRNGGKICSRAEIIDFLWDNQLYVDDNALSVNVGRIREKLRTIGLSDFIITKHRQGYTL